MTKQISLYEIVVHAMNHTLVHQVTAPDEQTARESAIDWTVEAALGAIPNVVEEIKQHAAEVYEAARICRRSARILSVECLATGKISKEDRERLLKTHGIPMKEVPEGQQPPPQHPTLELFAFSLINEAGGRS